MNPVKLKFRHGGEMLVSPIGLRFVEDPDHGPLVLIPEAQGPRGYQLDMTLEEAEREFRHAADQSLRQFRTSLNELESRISSHISRQLARWEALAICLGLPDGWEHHHELAAEVKGALVVQAEEIDELKKELSLLKEEGALFTLAERVGELEESRTAQRKINQNIEKRVDWLTDHYPPPRPEPTHKWEDRVFPMLDDRTCVQRQGAPVEITWTQAGPCNAATGQLIECSSWKAPEKPKSAWKPLCDLKLGNISDQLLVRRIDYSSICAPASIHHHGLELELAVLQWATPPAYVKQDQFHLYEFCPIPE